MPKAWSLRAQLALFCALVVLPPLLINAFAVLQPVHEPMILFRDLRITAQEHFARAVGDRLRPGDYCCTRIYGSVSQLGVMLLSATAGMLALGLFFDRLRGGVREGPLLLTGFVLTVLLALDDQFMLHEAKEVLGPLRGEALLFPLYAVLALSYLLHWRCLALRTAWVLLIALGFLSTSVAADQLLPFSGSVVVIEDVAKLFGLFFWFAWHGMLAAEVAAGRPLFFTPLDRTVLAARLRQAA